MEYLKGVTGQAKRPLQKDLDLAPTEGEGVVSVIYELKQCAYVTLSHNPTTGVLPTRGLQVINPSKSTEKPYCPLP